MKDKKFAVIDVETTGGGISDNRLTEICIVLLQGAEILDKYTTLINPEKLIPNYITSLTGIDNELLEDAPKFHEVADEIEEFTRDAVFVAHNVNFDYNVLRNEFKALGRNYSRKKLCTVRLSRKLIPGLFSYSLGKLCSSINIPLTNRHRAEGDTDATVILFQRLLDLDEGGEVLSSFLHPHSKHATLPPHISAEQIDELPETPGIYLFKDKNHAIIYAGKAKNIKKRVWSHFYDKKTKEYQLGQETSYIDFETTGNELLALLLESDYIRKKYPKFNRAQKRPTYTYQIINYRNQRGIIQLAIGRTKQIQDSAATFYNRALAQEMLEKLCETFNLCPKYCTLQSNVSQCSHYRIKNCEGVCDGSEFVEDYNAKVETAITSLKNEKETYVIKEEGRHKDEQAFVLVKEGRYHGYGFVDADVQIQNFEDYEPFLKLQESTFHTHQIISSYLRKKGTENLLRFDNLLLAE
ncbi:exonuclease domain-containing protein [Autumnicola psychrophila]|uniref:Exonuclease domain-containing protein n=1 Tax=Autumnicola psychrophila TaxID=3075592 RepID=A0ABU3DQR8_9FLAO|nr:exonuclease domain-containing protein [Zunongwangia sp. F225]MDT0685948.1 exonuclease domain-containing protein [Zunongwangia sp. F225]